MSEIDPETIAWTLITTEDWGGGPEETYEAVNVEHAGCGGDVRQVHLRDPMGGLLGVRSYCNTCGDDLTP
jgi:hypothetical protein